MQRLPSFLATAPTHPAVPHPPPSGSATAKPRRRTNYEDIIESSRQRRVSLNKARHVPKRIFTAPCSVTWPCTLRSSCDISSSNILGRRQSRPTKLSEGFLPHAHPQTVSAGDAEKLVSANRVPIATEKLCQRLDDDSSKLNDGCDGGLSSSTLTTCSPKETRCLSSPLGRSWKPQLITAAMEDELKWPMRSNSANVMRATNPLLTKLAAYDTLRLLFIPLWKLYRFHKEMVRATAIVANYVLLKVYRRRQIRREQVSDTILYVPQILRTKLRHSTYLLEARAIRIQRAFRRHRARVQAVVELNYRKVRRDVEETYWKKVVAQREAELAQQQQHPSSAVSKALREVMEARADVRTRFDSMERRHRRFRPVADSTFATTYSYELDVYNFFMIGRLPESLLRVEMISAVFAHLRRSAARAELMDDFSETRARRAAMEEITEQHQPPPTRAFLVRSKGRSCARLPRFLPESVYTTILDNTCYLTSLMRDDHMLRAHLRRREQSLVSY